MELQILYLQLAIFIYGFLSGFSSGSQQDQASNTQHTDDDHYDKAHPLALNSTHLNFDTITLLWSMPGNMDNYTSQLYNFIVYYHKRIDKGNINDYKNVSLPANQTSYVIDGLEPGTKYSFYVEANYTTGQSPASHTFTFCTNGYGPDRPCPCHILGSIDTKCNRTTGWCKCKGDGYADKKCEACKPKYYWNTRLGCQNCPKCNLDHSNGTCYVDKESHQLLCRCNSPWGGDKCNHCGTGFFMAASTGLCKPCMCNDNSVNRANLCNYKTGICERCKYNTTGDHCEQCLPGYGGDAVAGKNCTLIRPTEMPTRKGGVIVGMCIALFIIVIVVVSIAICRRMRGRKPKFNFWTVELKDDHEQVNFSQMMEQNDYNNGDLYMDDVLQYHDRAAVPATTPTHERPPLYRPNRPKMQGPYQTLEDRHREIC